MNHIRRSGGLFGVLAVFSVVLALFSSTGASAWSQTDATNVAKNMWTEPCRSALEINDYQEVIASLVAIPASATPAQIGGLSSEWPATTPLINSIKGEYVDLIMGKSSKNCNDINKIVTYGNKIANNNTSTPSTQAAIQKAIMDQVNPKIETWVDTLCKESLDTQCRSVKEAEIKALAASCYLAPTTTTSTKITSLADLEKCAGKNIVAAATAQQDCEATGKVWNTTTKACEEKKAGTTNCIIDGVGWIICPVANALATMTDKVFGLLKLMLETPPLSITPNASTNPLYGAWSSMRNIANVVFVIAFMIIIYSQITSAGISNYGIKKMLPKLMVSAILINVSFWICVLAIDVSNVLGSSIYNVLSGFATSGTGSGTATVSWVSVITVLLGGAAAGALTFGGVTIAATALGGAGALGTALLWLALPMLIAVSIAILIGVTVLALRQALIIILVFVSPLAFAAYLLPNTQVWFDKWRKLFTTMLVFYPLFAILFGGASIASWVLLTTASKAQSTALTGVLLLTGLLVMFLPLFLVPLLIKTSSGLLGKFATKMQGGVSRAANPLNKMARGRSAMNMGLAKGRLLTGSTTATNRFGRRTLGSRVNSLAQGIDSRSRTVKMMQDNLDTTRDANWQENVAHDQDLAALDTSTRTQKLRKDGSDAYREADWQEQVAQDHGLHELHTDEKVQKARAGSAQRRQEKEYLDTLAQNGQELYTAAGIDPQGEERVLASVVAAQQKSNREAVENSKALLYNEDPGLTIERATAQLRRASTDGDVVAGRAAAQVLRESGTPGKQALHDTVVQLEQGGGIHNDVAQGVKADGLASGAKGYDSAIDRWYAETDKVDASGAVVRARTLFTLANDTGSASRLNEPELAGQTAKILQEWERNGVLSKEQAQSVLDAHSRGTVPLDPAKFEIFTRAAAGTPMHGPVGPPPATP